MIQIVVENSYDSFNLERWMDMWYQNSIIINCVLPISLYNVLLSILYYLQMILFNNLLNSTDMTFIPTVILVMCKELIVFKGKTLKNMMGPILSIKIDNFTNHIIYYVIIKYWNDGIAQDAYKKVFFYFFMNFCRLGICYIFF